MQSKTLLALGFLAGLAAQSSAQWPNSQEENSTGYLGARAGLTWFNDSTLRDIFGNGKMTFGFSPVPGAKRGGVKIGTNLDFTIANSGGSRLLLVPLTVGAQSTLGNGGGSGGLMPFYGARVGVAYADYSLNLPGGGNSSGRRLLPTGNLEFGFVVQKNLTLSARYNLFQQVDGLSFNGLTFQATYALFPF